MPWIHAPLTPLVTVLWPPIQFEFPPTTVEKSVTALKNVGLTCVKLPPGDVWIDEATIGAGGGGGGTGGGAGGGGGAVGASGDIGGSGGCGSGDGGSGGGADAGGGAGGGGGGACCVIKVMA